MNTHPGASDASLLVPAPRSYTAAAPDGAADPAFVLDAGTVIAAPPGTEGVARWLRTSVGSATGLPLAPGDAAENTLRLALAPSGAGGDAGGLGPEGYRLTVEETGVLLEGADAAGLFWAAQTFRQLLDPAAFRRAPLGADRRWTVPCVSVSDAPRFSWRGFMLDVSRHFTPKEGVLRYLDLLAAHKLNVFHFHLTDDQGWRVEIERYPRLTQVGGCRSRTRVGHRASDLWDERAHGGRYTQDDIREIVAYAAERHITVVPEIDIPGHSQAAIAAYPELGNTDTVDTGALEVWTDWGVSPNVLAPSDTVLRFYENVLEEVLGLFPSKFVHIGGDECVKDQWRASAAAQARMRELGLPDEEALQSWFIRHFDRWLTARGRRLIGWDEILEGGTGGATGLSAGAAVSSWRGYAGGISAARAGHDVVMCPEQQVYLDFRQDGGADEPVPIGYVRTLADVHAFEPVPPELAGTPQERHVIGAQANMWTEVAESQQRLDYQVFPRLAAFAETVWSGPDRPAWPDFARRMDGAHYARLDALGVGYRPPAGPHSWQRRPGVLGRPHDGKPPIV
ncbi:beta-N-acetylhexosaminidase [Streptomyces sp. TRM 70351]|uniref:beta-N-acetylhexosaminidase n=1 Tax=Streptomyces sp. TRM 70351 TaxID=3116552 RepID=UPI002E7B6F30|nr:beta-N-acetylhexosaminidase [Streptomyces sp. TRM 70351]MEE1928106.1 beta-N-acetylhexosaminidase [Streptomyces sp. TRM 70351]